MLAELLPYYSDGFGPEFTAAQASLARFTSIPLQGRAGLIDTTLSSPIPFKLDTACQRGGAIRDEVRTLAGGWTGTSRRDTP